ncbi:DnaJ domain-containing protein [uncultured Hymenobacter sp.]|uniref:DnaJ domain-containing protein n=1 Tax=uncultured Hymenobacter sp. TaxID=170016 RepID=UPI0035CC8F20
MTQDHYQVLGVPANAAADTIKRAYRRLVVQYHPDKHGGDSRYEEQFKAVSAAYRVLGDAGRRASYDFQLVQARLRAEEERRRQQFRPAGQQVYGVPMPPPAPLRTRRPAAARERHYQPIPKQKVRFTRRDYALVAGILGLITLFGTVLVLSLNHWVGRTNYDKAQQAFLREQWSTAASLADQAISFRPDFAPARRLRGEIDELVYQQPEAALTNYQAALEQEQNPAAAARLHYRSGRCQMALSQFAEAETSFSRALELNPALTRAHLARGENRLLELNQLEAALTDLDRGLQRRETAGLSRPWRYVQLRGVALSRLGRLAEARRDYSAVLVAWPRSGRTTFLLGRLAQREGNEAAACEFFRRAVDLNYEYARAASALCNVPAAVPEEEAILADSTGLKVERADAEASTGGRKVNLPKLSKPKAAGSGQRRTSPNWPPARRHPAPALVSAKHKLRPRR